MPRGAGGGRPAKDGQTRHRNRPTRDGIIVPADARVAVVPKPLYGLVTTKTAKRLWADLWALPVATLWNPADVAALSRLVKLQTTLAALLDPRLLAEARQLEDRFLLNPYARAQQRVVLEGQEAGVDNGSRPLTILDDYRDRAQGKKPKPKPRR